MPDPPPSLPTLDRRRTLLAVLLASTALAALGYAVTYLAPAAPAPPSAPAPEPLSPPALTPMASDEGLSVALAPRAVEGSLAFWAEQRAPAATITIAWTQRQRASEGELRARIEEARITATSPSAPAQAALLARSARDKLVRASWTAERAPTGFIREPVWSGGVAETPEALRSIIGGAARLLSPVVPKAAINLGESWDYLIPSAERRVLGAEGGVEAWRVRATLQGRVLLDGAPHWRLALSVAGESGLRGAGWVLLDVDDRALAWATLDLERAGSSAIRLRASDQIPKGPAPL